MKRFLLFVMMCVCVSIGAWAGPAEGYDLLKDGNEGIGSWFVQGSSLPEEKVIYLKITKAVGKKGEGQNEVDAPALATALEELTTILNSDGNTGLKEHQKQYYSALGADNITNKRLILKVVYEPAAGEPATLTLSNEDLAALAAIDIPTIDLQDAKIANTGFQVNNTHVRNLILPDGYTKAQVNTAVIGCTNLGSAFSMNPDANISYTENNNNYTNGVSLTAYVKTGGTLWDAIRRSGYVNHKNSKVGTSGVDPYDYSLSTVKEVAILGYPAARDYCSGTKMFDANGHFQFDVPAIEQMDDQERNLVGTPAQGALDQANLTHLDLSDAIIYPQYEEDLILSKTGAIGSQTIRVDIPTSPYVTTLPADFLNMSHGICQLCIPSNIQYIRTRAFRGHTIDHIFTTDPNPTVKVDNGIVMPDGTTAYGYQESVKKFSDYKWATYTLSSNLLVIETAAFGVHGQRDPRVKDLYILAQQAPECHVDAFPTIMYEGNNRYDHNSIDSEGIITRDAYLNSNENYTWITMLHYPRECGTPDVQRYTDPTREYSVATGDVDGNGSPIYYPNQCEFDRAYQQGTTGFLWNAWDTTRDDNGTGAFANTSIDRYTLFEGWSEEHQALANSVYAANETTDAETLQFTSFYDVTANGLFPQPNSPTPLVPYYDVFRGGGSLHNGNTTGNYTRLYPAATTTPGYYKYVVSTDNTGTLYVKNGDDYVVFTGTPEAGVTYYNRVQTQAHNPDGSLMYEECNNNPQFVEDYRYEKSSNGEWVRNLIVTANSQGRWVKDYTWVKNNASGEYCIPYVQANGGYYAADMVQDDNGPWIFINGSWNLVSNLNRANFSYLTDEQWNAMRYTFTSLIPWNGDLPGAYNGIPRFNKGTAYERWTEGTICDERYDKVYDEPVNYHEYTDADAGETRYDIVDNGYVEYSDAFAGQQRYKKVPFYRAPNEGETPTHCPVMEDAEFHDVIASHDYRGWHQFVLTAYAHNSELIFEPLKSYISDNDWWTICVPYNLRYSDMKRLFGDVNDDTNIPYLSKLVYVVRDVENEKITLMFSNNLMKYKEYEMVNGEKKSINSSSNLSQPGTHVHGIVDDTEWTAEELAADPIILHRGVPYLIKPYMKAVNGKFNRQFDIYSENQPEELKNSLPADAIVDEWLYQSFKTSRNLSGDEQKEVIYKGEYQVPAYVINNTSGDETTLANDLTITMNDNSSFTYGNNSAFTFKNGTYDMKVSSPFKYTFVGTFYKSLMPEFSYFLGWNPRLNGGKGGAAFYYNRVVNTRDYNWNNETGIICANWSLSHKITKARSDIMVPSQWLSEGSGMGSDDFASTGTSQQGAKTYMDMEFGYSMDLAFVEDLGIATGVQDIPDNSVGDGIVYDIHGVKVGTSLRGLAKGVYIMNGKKYVVK